MIKQLHRKARILLFRHTSNDWQYMVQVILLSILIGFPFFGSWLPYPLSVFDVLFIGFVLYSLVLLESPSFSLLFTGLGALVLLSLQLGTYVDQAVGPNWLSKTEALLLVLFFILLGTRLTLDALRERISMKLLYISVINYFNIGILFSFLYRIEHFRDATALNFSFAEEYNYLYMSFVVLSSVGLGDLLPQNTPAKSLVIIEALLGQLYLTFFVAMIIGKYFAEVKENK
ncbi:MAG: potassium channel family protein [Cytophagales bacterium]|nr:potassium channel family protein [Cytophagales bacterium]